MAAFYYRPLVDVTPLLLGLHKEVICVESEPSTNYRSSERLLEDVTETYEYIGFKVESCDSSCVVFVKDDVRVKYYYGADSLLNARDDLSRCTDVIISGFYPPKRVLDVLPSELRMYLDRNTHYKLRPDSDNVIFSQGVFQELCERVKECYFMCMKPADIMELRQINQGSFHKLHLRRIDDLRKFGNEPYVKQVRSLDDALDYE